MSPLLIVAVVGIAVLLGLAVVIGARDRAARTAAWTRITEKHDALIALERSLQEQRRELVAWESALADETDRRQRS